MKNIIQRLRHRLAVSGHKKKQGVAILTVLAIITLMTVLVVSFFNMATTAKTTAKGSVEIQRVTTLKDTIINLVIAQFREASALTPISASNPREIVTWTSQPGAIRTFSGNPTDFTRNRLYKLYSSNVPQIEGIRPYESAELLKDIQKDLAADWAERPDEFTDLNRPVYTAASGDRARATGAVDSTGYSFPIADPRGYNGKDGTSDLERNIEGFTYSSRAGTLTMSGVDPGKEQLALPVRWIYLLQDGTLGYLNESKEFEPLNGANSGTPSRENPIVGRLAWWADDESCKVNVNTASVPSYWDTPRTTSKEDQWLARYQPIAGEFQRYPGHPATVDLCAIFYPNRRWVPPDLANILTVGQTPAGGKMSQLPANDAQRIWDLAPFIVGAPGELSRGGLGTAGGINPTPIDATVGSSADDRLFTSMDEVYFKASGATNKSVNAPRSNLLSENKDNKLEFLKTLERSQFFLTHKSHSPELTAHGYPRVSMYPMDIKAVASMNSGTLQSGVSPYDVTLAINSTVGGRSSVLGGNAYFFQRSDPTSRHNEWLNSSDTRQRNVKIFKYLKELSKLPIPGYPEAVPFKTPSVTNEDPTGLSLVHKYPPGVNGTGSAPWGSAFGTTSLTDSSERSQILLNMLDFTRALNMQPAFLSGADRYDDGRGMATGICGCANAAGSATNTTHFNALAFTNQTTRSPKGTGKLFGAAELSVIVNVAGSRNGPNANDPTLGAWNQLVGQLSPDYAAVANGSNPGTRYIVEVGFVMSAFSPKHGWSASFPQTALAISGLPASGEDPVSPSNTDTGLIGPGGYKLLTNSTTSYGSNENRVFPKGTPQTTGAVPRAGVSPLGGLSGPRATFGISGSAETRIATLRPFVVVSPTAGGQVTVPITANPNVPLRLMVCDGVGSYNVTQAIDIVLPSDFFTGLTVSPSNESLRTLGPKWANATLPFPSPQLFVRSLVLPHGDYRLIATPLRTEGDMFVPHANYASSQLAHSFFEMNTLPSGRGFTNVQYNDTIGMMNSRHVRKFILPAGGSNVAQLTTLPLPAADPRYMATGPLFVTASATARYPALLPDLLEQASLEPARRATFAHGRRDGRKVAPNRGSSDPSETGDFDTGVAADPDGPYMNYPDEGDRRRIGVDAYFKNKLFVAPKSPTEGIGGPCISPNFLLRSPVDFGSIPTGVNSRVPWQTLRFRPDFGMNNPQKKMKDMDDVPPAGHTFANFCGPKDHFFLDMFWMPVVEPWSISEPFSTKGTINLNQQILPFTYVERTTALHALLRGERMMAIPNEAAENYKRTNPTTGEPDASQDVSYRHFIDAKETVRQFIRRYNEGRDFDPEPPGGNNLAFNVFRAASEICELYLVPEDESAGENKFNLEWTIGTEAPNGEPVGFWADHRLTGDNVRERPYANLYPRVTVRSNVFKLHMVAQTLQKATSRDPKTFDSVADQITAEWRGSCMIERSIDPRDTLLSNKDYTDLNSSAINNTTTPKLDRYYTYRVTEVKQLTQ